MRLIYSENGVSYSLTQLKKNTFLKSEIENPNCAIHLQYTNEEEDIENLAVETPSIELQAEIQIEKEENTTEQNDGLDYPGYEDTISILAESSDLSEHDNSDTNEQPEEEAQEACENHEEPSMNKITSLQTIELEQPLIFEEEQIELPISKYLTSLNIQMVANVFEEAQALTEYFHKDRIEFVKCLYKFIDNQISQKDLKFIFTDVQEKKLKDEVKVSVKTNTCNGLEKENIQAATEIEKSIFTAYNVKNDSFSILGYKEETREYFGCFHLDSVNFLFMFEELNGLNKLQINLLKSFSTTFNHLIQEKRKSVKKKRSENKVKVPTNAMAAPPVSQTIQ